jgi:hypothetical protein
MTDEPTTNDQLEEDQAAEPTTDPGMGDAMPTAEPTPDAGMGDGMPAAEPTTGDAGMSDMPDEDGDEAEDEAEDDDSTEAAV